MNGLLIDANQYFETVVDSALKERKVNTFPLARDYLVTILSFYVPAGNLFDEVNESGKRSQSMLAEALLSALNSEQNERAAKLKRMADRALYIAGFFADSLNRKLVDVDYYQEMGSTAYALLAENTREDLAAKVYREYATRFLAFMEVLSVIADQAKVNDEQNILRLYETYARTGSDLARERLLERGLIAVPLFDLKKPTKQ